MIHLSMIDEGINRSPTGVHLVKSLRNNGYSDDDIKLSIHQYLDAPTQLGKREKGIIEIALKFLQQ